jgi:hypothetical protein
MYPAGGDLSPYAPECVEEEFCELRLLRILGRSAQPRPYVAAFLM